MPKGRFRLGRVESFYRNRFDLIVEAQDYAQLSTLKGRLSVCPGRDFDIGTIVLDRGCIFTGRVLDVDGKPCPNATAKPTRNAAA